MALESPPYKRTRNRRSDSMGDKGEGITEIDSHISKKYEIRRRIGKGVSVS